MSFTCACGKGYTRRSSLNRHKGQCPLVLLPIRFRKRKHDTKDLGQNQQQEQQEEESKSNQKSSCSSSIDQLNISDQSDEDESSKHSHSNTEEEADSDNTEQSDSQEERDQGRYLEEDELFFGHDPLSPASDHSIHNESDTDEKEHASHHPFPNMETALLYLWSQTQPRLSKRKLQGLLDVLRTPGFTLANVPKTAYNLQKYSQSLPILDTSEVID